MMTTTTTTTEKMQLLKLQLLKMQLLKMQLLKMQLLKLCLSLRGMGFSRCGTPPALGLGTVGSSRAPRRG